MDLLTTASSWKALSSPTASTHRHRGSSLWRSPNHPLSTTRTKAGVMSLSPLTSPCSFRSSPIPVATNSSQTMMWTDDDSDMSVITKPQEFVHARLDSSLNCYRCQASHALYLMYPVVKTLDTWNHENQFLCSFCHRKQSSRQQDEDILAPSKEEPSCELVPQEWVHSGPSPSTDTLLLSTQKYRPPQIQLISQDSCDLQECLDLLHEVEDERDTAMERLSEQAIQELHAEMREELAATNISEHQINACLNRETQIYAELWTRHWDLLAETVSVLQLALENQGDEACDLLLAYYQWRARHDDNTAATEPAWKQRADQVLQTRDVEAGVGPGHFWGATARTASTATATSERPVEIASDIIEELASPEESLFFQLFVSHNRGLGWNAAQRPEVDCSLAVYEAYAAERGVMFVVRPEQLDRDLTMKENAQQAQTLLIRVVDKITSPPAMHSSSHKPRARPREQMPTPTPTCKLLQNSPIPEPFTTEDRRFLSMEDNAQTNIMKGRPKGKSITGSRRGSTVTEPAEIPKRTGRMQPTTNKRDRSSNERLETDHFNVSKRGKTVPVVSAIKASPKRVHRGHPRNHSRGTIKLATMSITKCVLPTTTAPTAKKRGPGRPRKRQKGDDMSITKECDVSAPSFATEKVITSTPIYATPDTPASRTRSLDNKRKNTVEIEGNLGLEFHTMSDATVIHSRAPRRCMRCVQFGGHMAYECKGRGGQKNCRFFTSKGKALE